MEMGIEQILTYLTPFIVWLVTWVVGKVVPLIPGWLKLTVVTIVSAVLTWVLQIIGNPELSIVLQFVLGFLAVFVAEFLNQFSPEKMKSDNAARKAA